MLISASTSLHVSDYCENSWEIVSSVKVQKEDSVDFDTLNSCEDSMNSDCFL